VFRGSCATSLARAGFHLTLPIIPVHKTNSIVMHAPKTMIFETAANLELWPKILPHYRYIHYLEQSPSRNVVVMAATRSGIPISWTSEQIIDRNQLEVRFHHLKAFTKGMRVVWTFQDAPTGVLVEIKHDLAFRVNVLAPIAFARSRLRVRHARIRSAFLARRLSSIVICNCSQLFTIILRASNCASFALHTALTK